MSTSSRNRPCTCGSGLKFKKCCLPRQQVSPKVYSGLIIAMPTRGTISVETHTALESNIGPEQRAVMTVSRLMVVEARNKLAKQIVQAVERGEVSKDATILWIDDDAWFPPGTVQQLQQTLRSSANIGLAAGMFSVRAPRTAPVAYMLNREQVMPGANCRLGEVVDCCRVGFHFVTHRASLLLELPADPFTLPVNPTAEDSEDFMFCDRVRAVGKRVVCDTQALVAHVDPRDGAAYIPGEVALRVENNRLAHGNTAEHLYGGHVKRTERREYGLPELEAQLIGEPAR